jgi:hypothetical protein
MHFVLVFPGWLNDHLPAVVWVSLPPGKAGLLQPVNDAGDSAGSQGGKFSQLPGGQWSRPVEDIQTFPFSRI